MTLNRWKLGPVIFYSVRNMPLSCTLTPASSKVSLMAAYWKLSGGSTFPPGNHQPLSPPSLTARYWPYLFLQITREKPNIENNCLSIIVFILFKIDHPM